MNTIFDVFDLYYTENFISSTSNHLIYNILACLLMNGVESYNYYNEPLQSLITTSIKMIIYHHIIQQKILTVWKDYQPNIMLMIIIWSNA